MKFEEWFNQQELYGLKSERFYDIVMLHRDNPAYSESLVAWLRASYEAGKEDELKECIKTVDNSLVHQLIWYPKDYYLDPNRVGDIYKFQHTRSMDDLRRRIISE